MTICHAADATSATSRCPRPLAGPGRRQQYCSHACRQKAYRQRGGRASGTTGAQRRRQQTDTGAEIRDDNRGPKA